MSQANITVRSPVMDVKDFFGGVFGKILSMNVDIKIVVPLIKINEINVGIADGSMSNACSHWNFERKFLPRKCIRMGMKKEGKGFFSMGISFRSKSS